MKVGFVLLTAEDKESGRTPSYATIRTMALLAEAARFDSIWLYDHLLYRSAGRPDRGIWETWTTLSALAEATQSITLGTLVLCHSFRNPAVLAKMAVTLDEVSGGRLILGIGAGWNRPEFEAFGLPFAQRVDRFHEAVRIIRPLLKDGHANFNGRYYQPAQCEIIPRGPRLHGPPLLIGGFKPRMLRLTARYADMWNKGYVGPPHTLKKPLSALRQACAEEGRDPDTLDVTALVALALPGAAGPPAYVARPLCGSTKELACAFMAYEELGVSHLMIHAFPYSASALRQVAKAVREYRRTSPSRS